MASVAGIMDGATAQKRWQISGKGGENSWVNHADLFRIKGVAGQYAELLEAAGVDTVVELSRRNAENLTKQLEKENTEKNAWRAAPRVTNP